MQKDLFEYQHIIWDWNGTIINDLDLTVKTDNNILLKRKMRPICADQYREIFDFPIKDYYIKLGFDFENESFESIVTEFMLQYDSESANCKLNQGVEDLLKKIQAYNISQSILSAMSEAELIKAVCQLGLSNYFIKIMGLKNNFAESKVELGKTLIQNIDINRNEILMIGDTLHDSEVAKEIGVDCLLVAQGHQSKNRLKLSGIYVFDSLLDLL